MIRAHHEVHEHWPAAGSVCLGGKRVEFTVFACVFELINASLMASKKVCFNSIS